MTHQPASAEAATRLKVGVVGTAHWAREVHAPGAVLSGATELVGVWGRDPSKTEAFADRYDVRPATSLEDLVERVDVVTFAVPPQVQPGLAVTAARAGRHVVLEKPVATTLAAAEEVREAVREGGGLASVFFTRRFVPELERRLLEAAGEQWRAAHVVWHANFAAPGSPYGDSVWRAEPLAALWDLTPHVLSQLVPLLGPVETVTAQTAGHGVELRTHHATGAYADVSVSLRAPEPVDEFRLLRADGSELSLTPPRFEAVDAFAHALDRLAARVQDPETEEPASLDLGVEATRVIADAERSLLEADA